MRRKVLFSVGVFLVLVFFVLRGYASAGWCVPLKDMVQPDVIMAKAFVSFYQEPWSEWVYSNLNNRLGGEKSPYYKPLKAIYEKKAGNPLFFDGRFHPKPSLGVILSEREGEIDSDGSMKVLVEKVERELQNLRRQFPVSQGVDEIKVCPSREPNRLFFTEGLPMSAEKEEAVIKWSREQMMNIQKLVEVVFEADITLAVAMAKYAKTKGFYNNYVWSELVDNETDMVTFLNRGKAKSSYSYRDLEELLNYYERLSVAAEQPILTTSIKLKLGDQGDPVKQLQKRLMQEGYYNGSPSGYFDVATKEALAMFQRIHFLNPDGVAGKRTLETLNIPYSRKAEWIRLTLEALPSSPLMFYKHFVWINIPTFSLEYHVDGRLISKHKVIVGQRAGQPMTVKGKIIRWNNSLPLVSEIKSIVVNPRWYVPERIREELDNQFAQDETYFERSGFRILDSTYSSGAPRIYQLPGGRNPLGKVKFLFDNPYGFFLHDTSEPHLFKRYDRAISHGCIRVEGALDLAREIVGKDSPGRAERIDDYLKRSDQTYITLDKPIPIIITYYPVWISESGVVEFGGNLYGWDEREAVNFFFYVKEKSDT